jgi:hypothetical protein
MEQYNYEQEDVRGECVEETEQKGEREREREREREKRKKS